MLKRLERDTFTWPKTDAEVLELKQDSVFHEVKDKYLIQFNGTSSYFDIIFKLVKEEGCQIITDMMKKKL